MLMGELRGDLMTTTDNSSQELRDINESNIESSNSYLQEREYYELLNNCNYYIQHLDTAVTKLEMEFLPSSCFLIWHRQRQSELGLIFSFAWTMER